jgi:hypothetical protein
MIPPQKQMTGMLGRPVAENPIDIMFDAVYAHYGLHWQFWKSDIADEKDLALAVPALRPLGYRGVGITVPYKVAVIPLLDAVDDDVRAIGAANYVTIEDGRLIGHNNDGKGVVKAIQKVCSLRGQHVAMFGAGGAGRAMAMEIAWAGAARLTLVTRREAQGRGHRRSRSIRAMGGPPGISSRIDAPSLHLVWRRVAGSLVRLSVSAAVLLALLGAGLAFPDSASADAGPASCKMGMYVTSLSRIDTAAGTFDADFWMWSICPDSELEPLKTIEFVNGVKIDANLDSSLERGKQWWSTRKFSGTFQQDVSLANYPFDQQTLHIDMEEGVLDTRDLTYTADEPNTKVEPALALNTWYLGASRITASGVTHPTTYGDPSLTGGDSTYAQLVFDVGLDRKNRLGDFLKATFAVYVAGLLALVSLLILDGRVGLLGATMFTVVLSFVSLDRILGPHSSLYLLDKVHFATLALIMLAGAWGVRSMRAVALGADKTHVHRIDLRAALVLFILYVLTNAVLIISAIHAG